MTVLAWVLPLLGVLAGLALRRRGHLRRLRRSRALTGLVLDDLAEHRRVSAAAVKALTSAAAAVDAGHRRALAVQHATWRAAAAEVEAARMAAQTWGTDNLRRAWAAEDALTVAVGERDEARRVLAEHLAADAELLDALQQMPARKTTRKAAGR